MIRRDTYFDVYVLKLVYNAKQAGLIHALSLTPNSLEFGSNRIYAKQMYSIVRPFDDHTHKIGEAHPCL